VAGQGISTLGGQSRPECLMFESFAVARNPEPAFKDWDRVVKSLRVQRQPFSFPLYTIWQLCLYVDQLSFWLW